MPVHLHAKFDVLQHIFNSIRVNRRCNTVHRLVDGTDSFLNLCLIRLAKDFEDAVSSLIL
ncbi:hypothetical protein CVO76_12360 [Arthrobacter agilis]|uniref:Uncharacterized protein n=1 Tax=Arthrobacter agilis TaxID=37921 RepID=A0A2L0UGG2_9MICC|nr:hypothetical protein CVO76_12360 [Arthrobacter agilis]